eukprot:CAMPEP_0206513960 /NCGR_PEP_ID=MMETSP0324_2-20121206/61839_1 /ASSEMBLY_ACC=CAM_ASM_000836 /TAXON_ID=2866 /ORGANISM="Crypthecodinium cohnii, Strain Seligo" /LENGTH=38 /DNA_ID= /DNA_START= /DNA_END= /DNA_ORIENTATION=
MITQSHVLTPIHGPIGRQCCQEGQHSEDLVRQEQAHVI